jgi:hypothetical protein
MHKQTTSALSMAQDDRQEKDEGGWIVVEGNATGEAAVVEQTEDL